MNLTHSSPTTHLIRLLTELDSLPCHDAERFETLDALDNPDCNNGMRQEFAAAALRVFQEACHMNDDVNVAAADLIGDILHLVHASGYEPLTVLEAAIGHFIAEAGINEPNSP